MLPDLRLDDPTVNLVLEGFLHRLHALFGNRLASVMVCGSVVRGDLSPGYGDLDFVAVIDRELSDADTDGLREIRAPLRSGACGEVGTMLEGAFLASTMLRPGAPGRGFWWGTSGERLVDHNHLGWVCTLDLIRNGIVIYGEDVRARLPLPEHRDILGEIGRSVDAALEELETDVTGLSRKYCVDFLLQSARQLAFLAEGKLLTKSQGAVWAKAHAAGAWRSYLAECAEYRKNRGQPSDATGVTPLSVLREALREALQEVDHALGCRADP